MTIADDSEHLRDRVAQAVQQREPLALAGTGTRAFYGNPVSGDTLDTTRHRGVIDYQPEELMLRVRAGTRLSEVDALLADHGQTLGFDPPRLGGDPSMGEIVASGLAGPARPYVGGVRDFVLGVTLVTGEAEILSFGGQVMKNVAGYDVSRLSCGAWGTLGVLLDVSLRLCLAPQHEVVFLVPCSAKDFISASSEYATQMNLGGAMWSEGSGLYRVSGTTADIRHANRLLGGREVEEDVFAEARDQTFYTAGELWRVSVPATSHDLIEQATLIEWGGAQRWLIDPPDNPREQLSADGHATLVRTVTSTPRFQPLDPWLAQLHRSVKQVLDPHGILNPGKMYPEF